MARRGKMSYHGSQKLFRRTAMRQHPRNRTMNVPRGGIRA